MPEVELTRDEGIRDDASVEKLAGLRALFAADGTVTAGNSSSINDRALARGLGRPHHRPRCARARPVVVADLRSQPLATHRVVADGTSEDVAQRRRVLAGAVDEALVLAGRTRDEVGALCVGVPAPVDAAGRSPRHPEGFWDLMNPDLMSLFDWAVLRRVDNDASLAAVAEGAAGAAAGRRDYIALLAGDRLGAGSCSTGACCAARTAESAR